MNETMNSRVCERSEDLISFLYGELDEREARSFEQHRRDCPTCKTELVGFGSVHESVVAWRDQMLGVTSRDSLANSKASPLMEATKRSALAAVGRFFELSPLWLRGATAFAVILFCVLAGLAVFHFQEQTSPATTSAVKEANTAKEIELEVNRRVAAELAARKSENENSNKVAITKGPVVPGNIVRTVSTGTHGGRIAEQVPQKLRKPLTRAEREQLAADLRLISDDDEDSLDLLGDRINNR